MSFGKLLFLFIIIPIAELFLLLQIGARIGLMPTLGLIVLTGFLGAYIARQQGMSILKKIQSELRKGHPPAMELVEGAMIVVGGFVLLTPGVLTDCFGFALMIPSFRRNLAKQIQMNFSKNFRTNATSSDSSSNFDKKKEDVIDI